MGDVDRIFILCMFSLLYCYSVSFPLCTNSRLPTDLLAPLKFCKYNGSACCESSEDIKLQEQFEALNVSDLKCASLMRAILCARCDPYSAELFSVDTGPRSIPILCNSTVAANSDQSNSGASTDFCSNVWDICGNISSYNSPFSAPVQGRPVSPLNSPSKLTDRWKSKKDFCKTFGEAPDSRAVCYDGKSANFRGKKARPPIKGICLEKIANGSYISMASHPDGSDRVFMVSQKGKIWLATVPTEAHSKLLSIDESKPFLDISDQVLYQTNYGLLDAAFHPDFTKNGRFFVSYNCDKLQNPACSGRCSCNPDAKCDPASLPSENGIMPCQYHNVIAEYSAKPPSAEIAEPSEVRRIFTMGLALHKGHAGQLLFGPADGYLYTSVADGSQDDQYNLVQNKKFLIGKILRLDVNKLPDAAELNSKNLWGNYSIPEDNPYTDDKELLPEIWAWGFRNPWRCSFDAERPSYLLCGDAGQGIWEEVDIITRGGNYGWPLYEGPFLRNVKGSQRRDIPPHSIFSVMGHNRSDISGSASAVIGGYFYRSKTDPCLYGRYLFTDVYKEAIWVGTELPENSGNFTTVEMTYTCAKDSPIPCNTLPGGSGGAAIGYTFSFGEDNRKDIYILTSTGVYRIARPSRCDFSCSEESQSGSMGQVPGFSSSSHSCTRKWLLEDYVIFWFVIFGGYYLAG